MIAYILRIQNDISIEYTDDGMLLLTSWGGGMVKEISVWNELKPMECDYARTECSKLWARGHY